MSATDLCAVYAVYPAGGNADYSAGVDVDDHQVVRPHGCVGMVDDRLHFVHVHVWHQAGHAGCRGVWAADDSLHGRVYTLRRRRPAFLIHGCRLGAAVVPVLVVLPYFQCSEQRLDSAGWPGDDAADADVPAQRFHLRRMEGEGSRLVLWFAGGSVGRWPPAIHLPSTPTRSAWRVLSGSH
jgi:hypothetical protein